MFSTSLVGRNSSGPVYLVRTDSLELLENVVKEAKRLEKTHPQPRVRNLMALQPAAITKCAERISRKLGVGV